MAKMSILNPDMHKESKQRFDTKDDDHSYKSPQKIYLKRANQTFYSS